jgi:hypothetical protein
VSANHLAVRLNNRHFRREQVVAIREAIAAGANLRALSDQYDVSRKTIENIAAGRTYRDFGGPIREPRS